MISLLLKAAGAGFVLYGLALSARNGLNKAAVRRHDQKGDEVPVAQ